MKVSHFLFFLVILSSLEARRIRRSSGCPLIPPSTTVTSTTSTTTTTPTTTTTTSSTPITTSSTPITTSSTPTTTTTTTSSSTTTTGALDPTSPIPGLIAPGNPVGMNTATFVENVEIPDNVVACSNPRFHPDSTGIWTFAQIADAFYEYALKPWNFPNPTDKSKHINNCVAALVTVAGECATPVGKVGCSTHSGPSGVYQTDFLRTIPGFPVQDVMNLCLSSFGAGYMAAPFLAAPGKSCTISMKGGAAASMFTCYQAWPKVEQYGDSCRDPKADPSKSYQNYIGPFCHKSYSSRWSPCTLTGPGCCALFNGGGNSYQVPFPQYYYDMSMTQGGMDYLSICTAAAALGPA